MRVTTLFFTLAAAAMPMFITGDPAQHSTGSAAYVQEEFRQLPPEAWLPQDPADSLYRSARSALRRNEFPRAAELFRQVRDKYPRSGYAAEAYYWEAFSLYRVGGKTRLEQARNVLKLQKDRHPGAVNSDARQLATRVCGALAEQGDAECASLIAEEAGHAVSGGGTAGSRPSTERCQEQLEALNALLQMDADRALPLLKRVLARRDNCVELRRQAVFLVSQKQTNETEDILLNAARNDADHEVREQAVFWLSQVGTERSVTALDSILRTATDRQLQEKAIFALSQVNNARAGQALRNYVERDDASNELRELAIFWLGQQNNPENARYLQGLYPKLNSQLKEKIIFSLSQMNDPENTQWIMNLALNESEPIEVRKQALFWAGQSGGSIADLIALYGRVTNVEMKEQLIFVYSQRNEKAAVDKLLDIAKNDSDREMRKKALFWLSQSNDPRVADFVAEIIDQ